jgi:hypothetical protein
MLKKSIVLLGALVVAAGLSIREGEGARDTLSQADSD